MFFTKERGNVPVTVDAGNLLNVKINLFLLCLCCVMLCYIIISQARNETNENNEHASGPGEAAFVLLSFT